MVASVGLFLLAALPFLGCGDDDCPSETEALTADEQSLYRQLEVCVSRVVGVTVHRGGPLPRVERDPELVACQLNESGMCVTTPRGEVVSGFYLAECDTFAVAMRLVLLHEMLHPILCDVPGRGCDPDHTSPAWQECQTFGQCPEGQILLAEKACDGTPDCPGGADEEDCP